MSRVLKVVIISLDFIINAYGYLFDLDKIVTGGSISILLVVPNNFNVIFLPIKKCTV
jgi:hypothetical protein